jgi:hypothetical protein
LKLRNLTTALVLSALTVLVAGCGSDDPKVVLDEEPVVVEPVGVRANGAYSGTTSTGYQFIAIFLDDDQFWMPFGNRIGGQLYVVGLVQGQLTANNGTYQSAGAKEFATATRAVDVGGRSFEATLSGTLTPATGDAVTFSGSPVAKASHDYAAAASLATVVGAWPLRLMGGAEFVATVDETGAIAATIEGCPLSSGWMRPATSGKNVFDVMLTYENDEENCEDRAGTTLFGVAISLVSGSRRQLFIPLVNGARTIAEVLVGDRALTE